ncbi:tetratricopeptide repeat protein [Parvibaculum sp.]|uniref:tetratricopeptide repeat protein n=1 Tax=Parvibaculum sp. TaxID=2024848 RepID=UPI001B035A29|nr:tetratricopeptide repeat protein [Parvibaculum sp.]MBO6667394.1 tetratricopeptide repeat protein [Parvibaculum sp.]MBO6692396.1 tetratricopeptide repeat protein [Parvibaculum sp.]MBO6713946.1 tetratricopeptide repeat protein [Parvibaculum sp.]
MTDLFREVEEDLRREQFSKLWEKYGAWVIGLAVGIVVLTAAFVGWRAWNHSQRVEASAAYSAVVKEVAAAAPQEAAEAYAGLAAEIGGGYETLALLREADSRLAAGEGDAARAIYEQVANDGSLPSIVRGLAAIKAGLLVVDTASYADMKARMAPYTSGESAWHGYALELVALSAMKAGEWQVADTSVKEIIANPATPSGLRDRAHVMQALIAPNLPRAVESEAAPAPEEASPDEETQTDTQETPAAPAETE